MPTVPVRHEWVDVRTLHEHPDNPRRGDVDGIAASIDAHGFFRPLVVHRRTRRVLAGNHRLRAASLRGLATLPVVWFDGTDAAARRVLLADNKSADGGTYDEQALAAMLVEVGKDGPLESVGFTAADLEQIVARTQGAGDQSAALQPCHEVVVLDLTPSDAAALRAEFEAQGLRCTLRGA
jgi:ParB-like chromosome segregation protein Spo0J